MNATQQNRHHALLRASGFEDCPALTAHSTQGGIAQGRELSIGWLTGTVMTGLTSVLLMGAALYVSFQGQATFSTAYEALQIVTRSAPPAPIFAGKTNRDRPVAEAHSEMETIEASVKETLGGKDIIRKEPFIRIRSTLATLATALSDDVPAYDPSSFISAAAPIAAGAAKGVNTDIYGAEVEGEVAMAMSPLPAGLVPPTVIDDKAAAEYVRMTNAGEDVDQPQFSDSGFAPDPMVHDLGVIGDASKVLGGVAENVTVMPMNRSADDASLGRTERVLTVRESSPLDAVLRKNGFTDAMIASIATTLHNVYPSTDLPAGAHLRILFGPSRTSATLIPVRMSIYVNERHAATVALTDNGQYVLGLAPPPIAFPKEDTEDISVANLPSIYRSLWETARKHDIADATIRRIIGMYAFDMDLTRRISPGDSLEILETPPDSEGHQDLLYVNLKLSGTDHELFRFRTEDGTTNFYNSDGDSGKRFLIRRPLSGGGRRVSSPFGWRMHPVFHRRIFHTGVDLASPDGTPIYAAGTGVVERAGWASGYGRFVLLRHANGYETGYGHMSKIASLTVPGRTVLQGQVIGYVGHSGDATGPHLHFEIRINGHFVNPLSVKLPRDRTLPPSDEPRFAQTMGHIHDLMEREGTPTELASLKATSKLAIASN